jgi:hypothetical protein
VYENIALEFAVAEVLAERKSKKLVPWESSDLGLLASRI